MPASPPSGAAISEQQIAPAGWTNDIIVVLVGVAVYLLLGFYFHPYVIGMPVFAGA